MNLCETYFINGEPVGTIRQCAFTGQINFSPLKGKSPLADREWQSVDELKAAVLAAYGEGPPDDGA